MRRRPPSRAPLPGQSGAVRIIGGRWRNTRLPVVVAEGLRPTSDRARETLFNWLQRDLPGARVLDLFAGSGALGLEALSRDASQALLVEQDAAACTALNASIDRLDAAGLATVVRADALGFLRVPLHGRFDIVFLDPPFAARAWQPVFALLMPWIADDALLYVESPASEPAAAEAAPGEGWQLHREGATRDARHALYRRVADRSPAGGAATLQTIPFDPSISRP